MSTGRLLMAASLAAAALTASAKTTAWRNDAADNWDWTKPENFSNGIPSAGDIVEIPEAMTVYATNAHARTLLAELAQISPQGKTAVLTVDVPAGETATSNAAIVKDSWSRSGILIKRGDGTLVLNSESLLINGNDCRDYLLDAVIIERGTLAFKQDAQKNQHFNRVDVAAGATLLTAGANGKITNIANLSGAGMVTNTASSAQILSLGTSTFDGVVARGVKLNASGRVTLTNPASTCEIDYLAGNNGDIASGGGVLCVPSFGAQADLSSPAGLSPSFMFRAFGGGMVYLGAGETTDKKFMVDQEELRGFPAFIDGGANGGLVLTGEISPLFWRKTAMQACMVLTGSNTVPCTIAGKVLQGSPASSSDSDKIPAPICFRKQGSGIWRFSHNWLSTFASCIAVDEGTLQFDTLQEAGSICSLGYGNNLIEMGCGNPVAEAARVEYAYMLGTPATSGTLEYVGTNPIWCATRPVALNGTGALRNDTGKPFRFSGVKPLTAGPKTLKLTGAGAGGNEIAGICDGPDRPVSVVKEGEGVWTLNGSNTFSGSLSVSAGTLNVKKPAAKYTWFRWNLGEGYISRVCQFYFAEFGLYDAAGNRINAGTVFNQSTPSLEPGEIAYSGMNEYGYDTATLYKLFDGDVASATVGKWLNPKLSNHTGRGQTLVMRVAEDSPAVASYDVAMAAHRSNNEDRAPKAWTLEASVDGIHWDLVHAVEDCGDPMTGMSMWCGAARQYAGDAAEPDGKHTDGYALPAPSEPPFTVLDSVSSVAVAAGATLKAEGEPVELRRLTIDAQNAGTLDGFGFAENGELAIVNASESGDTELPLTLANAANLHRIRNWSCTVNGQKSNRMIAVANGRLWLRHPGMVIIIR